VVFRHGRRGREYLLVSSSGGNGWVLPKGHVERGETVEETAVREVKEESGVEAAIVSPLSTLTYSKGKQRVRAAFFLMRVVKNGRSRERRKTRWLSFEDAAAVLAYPNVRALLRQAEQGRRSPGELRAWLLALGLLVVAAAILLASSASHTGCSGTPP
jgi:8-oxo-dGTP pyrophosphatase MutT (NUDIX family)